MDTPSGKNKTSLFATVMPPCGLAECPGANSMPFAHGQWSVPALQSQSVYASAFCGSAVINNKHKQGPGNT